MEEGSDEIDVAVLVPVEQFFFFLLFIQSVEEDFVDMRKDDPASVSAEDLHRLLVVARWAVSERMVQKLYTDSYRRACMSRQGHQ